MKIPSKLLKLKPCSQAVEWLAGQKNLQAAWVACERGEWMLWLAGKVSGKPASASRKKLVRAACACARLVLPIFEREYPDDNRPRQAIETAERHVKGKATLEEVQVAAHAAFTAATTYIAANVAATAAIAAETAAGPIGATAADWAAAAAAANADAFTAAAAARKNMLKQCADEVRKIYPRCPL